MQDIITLLFFLTFMGQVFFLSYYFPCKIRDRMEQMMDSFPPDIYPRLYPKPLEYYARFYRNYTLLNHIMLGVGVVVFFAMAYWGTYAGREISNMIPWAYFMVQMGPVMWVEASEYSGFKRMRKADLRMKKTASLQPRRLFDLLSPILFSIAVFAYFSAVFFSLYINDFDYHWGGRASLNIAIMTGGHLFFIAVILWSVYGKKKDPYQGEEDRIRVIKITINSLIYVSVAVSIFMMTMQAIDVFALDILKPMSMSIYLQILVFASLGSKLQALQVEDFNFDVYKADA